MRRARSLGSSPSVSASLGATVAAFAAFAAFAAATAACGPPPAAATATGTDDGAARVAAFQSVEEEVLLDLAALDRRVAARARVAPRDEDLRRVSMAAVLAEDGSLAVIDAAIDPFSFEARARGLAAARKKLEGAPGALPEAAAGAMSAPAFERDLLARLVDEEIVRLDEERRLPRSASALLRAIVETWSPPSSPDRAAERDRWLGRRLAEITAALSANALDVVRARELDDALDALEHLVDGPGFGRATAELVRLREVLEVQGNRPAAAASSDWEEVSRALRAHLGALPPADALEGSLDAAERALRPRAEAAASKAGLAGDALATRVAAIVFGEGAACADDVKGSRVRSMTPPPERIALCRLHHAAAAAAAEGDEAARAAVLIALHEHVIVAQWALDVARGKGTLAQASGRHRPMSRPSPDTLARWERVALARPAAAIAAGLGAAVLHGSDGDVAGRARKWAAIGDVPLDVAERELGAKENSAGVR